MGAFAGLGAWIVALGWPLVSRVLVAAGIGTVTYVGLSVVVSQALASAKGALSGLGGDVAQLVAMSGAFDALGIIAGGIIAGLAFVALKSFGVKATGA